MEEVAPSEPPRPQKGRGYVPWGQPALNSCRGHWHTGWHTAGAGHGVLEAGWGVEGRQGWASGWLSSAGCPSTSLGQLDPQSATLCFPGEQQIHRWVHCLTLGLGGETPVHGAQSWRGPKQKKAETD